MKQSIGVLAALALMTFLLVPSAVSGQNQQQPMGFFITSAGPGDGANLGGLEGANQHCQMLATSAGAGNRTWHAYLSTVAGEAGPRCMHGIKSAKDPGTTRMVRSSPRTSPTCTETCSATGTTSGSRPQWMRMAIW